MSTKHKDQITPLDAIKNEATRQRWELFHRAIAHAKQSNVSALQQENGIEDSEVRVPLRTVARG